MKRRGRLADRIPADVAERAEKAGINVEDVDWYAGRLNEPTAYFSAIPKDELADLQRQVALIRRKRPKRRT